MLAETAGVCGLTIARTEVIIFFQAIGLMLPKKTPTTPGIPNQEPMF